MACPHDTLHSIYQLVAGGFGAVCAACGTHLTFDERPELFGNDTYRQFTLWLGCVTFRDWHFAIRMDGTRPYLQVTSPDDGGWAGRKWFLSPHMTHSEVVQTAFKAVLTAVEHEAREAFRYKGHAVYSPHYDVEALVALHESEAAMDVRTP